MSGQLDLFVPPPPKPLSPEERIRMQWATCWPEWEGPRVGGYCEVHEICATKEEGGSLYCYMEQCRLLEERPDGSWLAVIEMGEADWHGRGVRRWDKDGTRLILPITNIWPPTKILRAARDAQEDPEEKAERIRRIRELQRILDGDNDPDTGEEGMEDRFEDLSEEGDG